MDNFLPKFNTLSFYRIIYSALLKQIVEEQKFEETNTKLLSSDSIELEYDFTLMADSLLKLINYINEIKPQSKDYLAAKMWLEIDSSNLYTCQRTYLLNALNTFIDSITIKDFGYRIYDFEKDLEYYINKKTFINQLSPLEVIEEYERDSLSRYIKNQLLQLCIYESKAYSNVEEVLTIKWKQQNKNSWNCLTKCISNSDDPIWELVDSKTNSKHRIISPKLDYYSSKSVPFNFRSRKLMRNFFSNKRNIIDLVIDNLEKRIIIRELKTKN